jgi:hypothetical protein
VLALCKAPGPGWLRPSCVRGRRGTGRGLAEGSCVLRRRIWRLSAHDQRSGWEELTPIGEPEVREFFADLKGHIPDPAGIDVEAWTQAALDGLPAGPGRLGALSARLSEFADLLTNVR